MFFGRCNLEMFEFVAAAKEIRKLHRRKMFFRDPFYYPIFSCKKLKNKRKFNRKSLQLKLLTPERMHPRRKNCLGL